MTNILELLKNEKVEWKKLGDIKEIKVITAKIKLKKNEYSEEGEYPIIDQGQDFIIGYTNKESALFDLDEYVIFGDHTESVKYVDFRFAQGADGIKVLKTDKSYLKPRYLYHAILNFYEKQGKYMRHFSLLKQTEIPIPSPEIQEKIVEILDKFTNYVTELQSELQSRTKQYIYYRDKLLSEEYLTKVTKEMEEDRRLNIVTLGEIGEFTRGNGLQKKDFQEEGNPVIHYGQIYTKYGFIADEVLSYVNDEIFSKLRKAQKNDILIATTSENIADVGKSVVWIGEDEIGFSGDMYSYRTQQNSKYIAYYFQTNAFQRQKERKVTGTKMTRIHGDDMEKIEISLPPLSLQNKIVKVLDKFQVLLADTKGLLPEEIEQRQKQYEYYREKLLTFDEVSDRFDSIRFITSLYYDILQEAANIVEVDIEDKVQNIKLLNNAKVTKLAGYEFTKYVKYQEEGKIIALRGLNVKKGKIVLDNVKYIDNSEFSKLNRSKLIKNDILFTYVGTVGEVGLIEENNKYYLAPNVALIRVDQEKINPKYMIHLLQSNNFKNREIEKRLKSSSMKNLTMENIREFSLFLPPLHVQQHVVSILDKFDTLVNDIKVGLPKEIEQRQKQYEYWREQLLSFNLE